MAPVAVAACWRAATRSARTQTWPKMRIFGVSSCSACQHLNFGAVVWAVGRSRHVHGAVVAAWHCLALCARPNTRSPAPVAAAHHPSHHPSHHLTPSHTHAAPGILHTACGTLMDASVAAAFLSPSRPLMLSRSRALSLSLSRALGLTAARMVCTVWPPSMVNSPRTFSSSIADGRRSDAIRSTWRQRRCGQAAPDELLGSRTFGGCGAAVLSVAARARRDCHGPVRRRRGRSERGRVRRKRLRAPRTIGTGSRL